MATRPTNDLLVWANTDVNLPNLAGPNKTEPSADLLAKGWDFKQKPSADEFNYILNNLSEWVEYLRTLTAEGTPLNTPSTLVERDVSGNFAASTITSNLTGNVTGNVNGNAGTATKWKTPRTLTATGFATGTATGIDGSGNISLSLSVGSGFTNSKTENGYTYLPNGFIFQWGVFSLGANSSASQTITLPVSFPTRCVFSGASPSVYVVGATEQIGATGSTTTITLVKGTADNSARTGTWFALGF